MAQDPWDAIGATPVAAPSASNKDPWAALGATPVNAAPTVPQWPNITPQQLAARQAAAKAAFDKANAPNVPAQRSNITDLMTGVDPATFLDRLKGAASTMTNMLPGGSTPRPNADVQLNPQQEIGAKTMAVGGLAEAGQALAGGLLGAPEAASSLPKAAQKSRMGSATVNNWIQVAPKEMEYGSNPGARLVKEGLVRTTKTGTQQAVTPAFADAGNQLGAALQDATAKGKIIDASNIVSDALDSEQKPLGVKTVETFRRQLDGIFDQIVKDYPDIDKLTPTRAQELKKFIGDSIKWHGNPYEGDINQALLQAYRGINNELKTIPGIDPLQQRWGDLYVANKSLNQSLIRDAAGQGTGNIHPWISRGVKGAVVGSGVGAELYRLTR